MPASMETADAVMKECVPVMDAEGGPELPQVTIKPPSLVQYTVEIHVRNTVVSIRTRSEEHMAELVHLVKGYFDAS